MDNALPKDACDSLIKKYDANKKLIKRDNTWMNEYRSFTELNLTTDKTFKEEQKLFYDTTKNLYELYKQKLGIQFFPTNVAFEEVRMKKYENNAYDQFGWHTDVGDYASARRFLVMFFYLNDVDEGGQTIFNDTTDQVINLTVKPKAGRVVVFPPMWMYPHKALQPISNPKYIVSTYLHYV
jgi:hypothetical protein